VHVSFVTQPVSLSVFQDHYECYLIEYGVNNDHNIH